MGKLGFIERLQKKDGKNPLGMFRGEQQMQQLVPRGKEVKLGSKNRPGGENAVGEKGTQESRVRKGRRNPMGVWINEAARNGVLSWMRRFGQRRRQKKGAVNRKDEKQSCVPRERWGRPSRRGTRGPCRIEASGEGKILFPTMINGGKSAGEKKVTRS